MTLGAKLESFLVSKENRLLPGEEERARAWGGQLATTIGAGQAAERPSARRLCSASSQHADRCYDLMHRFGA